MTSIKYKLHPASKSVFIQAENEHVLKSLDIPYKKVKRGSQDVIAIRHKPSDTKKLRDAGIPVESTIYRYEFPKIESRWEPMSHQTTTTAFIVDNHRCAVLNGTGTGKTYSLLWAFDHLKQEGDVDKLLVVSPISTLVDVWSNSRFATFYELSDVTLYHPDSKKRRERLQHDVDIYIINFDGLKVLEKELKSIINERWMVAVDEASMLRNHDTKLYTSADSIFSKAKRLCLMTATPTPNEPPDAWALARLINKGNVPRFKGTFKRATMVQVSQFNWIAKPNANELVLEALQPCIRFDKKDCLDLPDMLFEDRHVELSEPIKKAYDAMRKEMEAELGEGLEISAANAADKVTKLRQVLLGVVKVPKKDGEFEYVEIDVHPRVSVIKEIVETSGEKIILVVPFKGAIHGYAEALGKKYVCKIVNGDTSERERASIFQEFHTTNNIQVLLVHPKVCSHGVNLQSCSIIVFAAPIYSADEYEQLLGRIARKGQTNKMTVFRLYGTSLEERIYKMVENKMMNQQVLLDLYKEITEKSL